MKYLSKILLVISLTMFLASLTAAGSNIHYGMLKPVSAILFIVSFILHVTHKEVEKFETEQEQTRRKILRARIGTQRAESQQESNESYAVGHATRA
jgi:hypothetical protein